MAPPPRGRQGALLKKHEKVPKIFNCGAQEVHQEADASGSGWGAALPLPPRSLSRGNGETLIYKKQKLWFTPSLPLPAPAADLLPNAPLPAHPSRHGGRPHTHASRRSRVASEAGSGPATLLRPWPFPCTHRDSEGTEARGGAGRRSSHVCFPPPLARREGAPAPQTVSPPRLIAAPPHAGMAEGLFSFTNTTFPLPPPAWRMPPFPERGAGVLASGEEAFPRPSGAPAIFLNRRHQVPPVSSFQGGCQGIIFHFLLATVKYPFKSSKAQRSLVRAKEVMLVLRSVFMHSFALHTKITSIKNANSQWKFQLHFHIASFCLHKQHWYSRSMHWMDTGEVW